MRLRPADIDAIERVWEQTRRSVADYHASDNPPPRSTCGCGARTRSETGMCCRCTRQETR